MTHSTHEQHEQAAVIGQRAAEDRTPVTVIGLGPMGAALAEAYLNQGHPTTVWNRTPGKADELVARGARRADSVTGAVTASPLIVVCLKDYPAMYGVLEQAADGALAGRTLVNHSSGTPEQAREAVGWATGRGAEYLDGAIMVPVTAVGHPDAKILYSGPRAVFDTHRTALAAMGGTTYLGAEPELAVLYNTALLGLMYATLNGFLHSAALVGTAGVKAATFAELAVDWFLPSVVNPIIVAGVPDVDRGRYPGDLGNMEMNLTAIDHVLHTSAQQGIDTDHPALLKALAERAVAAGRGGENYMAMAEVFRGRRTGGAGGG
ncbi:NAD(P)-dependent oxidoreductase [Streptomyces pactum]|uniref:NAD(P)-dependent oxidoreductase n=1 Tax=Streptomyces pactum TaxID=68249 RepID=A0ABS0NMT4_9ACTN|nr:NAD(P)-binding domain-containing protein [Streptomyces pactum]MBH5336481.1 NAD(P)-dependent oxidoreductase [Streptomyces pactum]